MTAPESGERLEFSRKPRRCPDCGSGVATILWGMPAFSEELHRDLEAGKITIGGCIVSDDDPKWECTGCGARLYKAAG